VACFGLSGAVEHAHRSDAGDFADGGGGKSPGPAPDVWMRGSGISKRREGERRGDRIVQAVDDVIARHEERVDARKDDDLAFLRTLRESLVGNLRGLLSPSRKEESGGPLR
jgi:hypothetical protein